MSIGVATFWDRVNYRRLKATASRSTHDLVAYVPLLRPDPDRQPQLLECAEPLLYLFGTLIVSKDRFARTVVRTRSLADFLRRRSMFLRSFPRARAFRSQPATPSFQRTSGS